MPDAKFGVLLGGGTALELLYGYTYIGEVRMNRELVRSDALLGTGLFNQALCQVRILVKGEQPGNFLTNPNLVFTPLDPHKSP